MIFKRRLFLKSLIALGTMIFTGFLVSLSGCYLVHPKQTSIVEIRYYERDNKPNEKSVTVLRPPPWIIYD